MKMPVAIFFITIILFGLLARSPFDHAEVSIQFDKELKLPTNAAEKLCIVVKTSGTSAVRVIGLNIC